MIKPQTPSTGQSFVPREIDSASTTDHCSSCAGLIDRLRLLRSHRQPITYGISCYLASRRPCCFSSYVAINNCSHETRKAGVHITWSVSGLFLTVRTISHNILKHGNHRTMSSNKECVRPRGAGQNTEFKLVVRMHEICQAGLTPSELCLGLPFHIVENRTHAELALCESSACARSAELTKRFSSAWTPVRTVRAVKLSPVVDAY